MNSQGLQADRIRKTGIPALIRYLLIRYLSPKWVAAASVLMVPAIVEAAPFGNPLDDVSNSTPTSSYAAPTGYGNLTGADGDVGNSQWIAVTDSGYAHIMDGANSSPLATIDTGISGLTGIAIKGYDGNDFIIGLSAGTTIYEGKLSQTAWAQSNTIDLTTSNLTDIDHALGAYFVATESDGIRKVGAGGSTSEVQGGAFDAVDIIEFLPNTYDNGMMQRDGEIFANIDTNGTPFGSIKSVDFDSAFDIQGMACYGGDNPGMAVAIVHGAYIHDPQTYQQHIQDIPEPASLTLLGLGGLGLLGARYRKQGSLFLPEHNEK